MLRELSALYGAGGVAGEAADRPADLPERRVEYADVATWQREWMSEADLAVQRAYWETQLAGVDKPTRIADADADERAAHPSAAVPVGFSPNLSAAVRRLATATGATPYMTILAGLYATLAAETGDEDLLVASLVSSRTLPETETLLGNFSNTLLLRQHLPANSTFSDTLRQVKADVLDAYRHQDYPFVEVQRFVNEQASRRADASPYQVLLIVRDSRLDRDIQLTGVQAEAHLVDLGQTRLPLSIDLVDDGASPIGGRVTYAADLFDASAVEAFVQRLVAVLERAVQDPGMSIDALGRAGDSPSVRSANLERDIQKIGF
jgi:non-ribosomal peptide synthetase component F